MAKINDYYVYAHIDPNTDTPFYIGKGREKRAYSAEVRSKLWKEKVEELNGRYEVKILYNGLSEDDALNIEEKLIYEYGFNDDGTPALVNSEAVMSLDLGHLVERAFQDAMENFKKEHGSEVLDKLVASMEEEAKRKEAEKIEDTKDILEVGSERKRKELVNDFENLLRGLIDTHTNNVDDYYDVHFDEDEGDYSDEDKHLFLIIEDYLRGTLDLSIDFRLKRMTTKEFFLDIEYCKDEFTGHLDGIKDLISSDLGLSIKEEYLKLLDSIMQAIKNFGKD